MMPETKKTVVSVSLEADLLEKLDMIRHGEFHGFWTESRSRMLKLMIEHWQPLIEYTDHLREKLGLPVINSFYTISRAKEYIEERDRQEAEREAKILPFPAG